MLHGACGGVWGRVEACGVAWRWKRREKWSKMMSKLPHDRRPHPPATGEVCRRTLDRLVAEPEAPEHPEEVKRALEIANTDKHTGMRERACCTRLG